jgi:hypothetical protein
VAGASPAAKGTLIAVMTIGQKARESEWTDRLNPDSRDQLRLGCRRDVRGG